MTLYVMEPQKPTFSYLSDVPVAHVILWSVTSSDHNYIDTAYDQSLKMISIYK